MSLREEIREYRQSDGLVSPDKNPTPDSTGNGLLYTCLYFISLVRLGSQKSEDYDDFIKTISRCQIVGHDGLFSRSSTKDEQDSPDDYIGICSASQLLNAPFAKLILMRGIMHRFFCFRWIYNNRDIGQFTTSSWFGRMPQVIAHFQWTAGLTPNIFRKIYWNFSIISASLFNVKSSTILTFLLVGSSRDGFFVDIVSNFWESAIIRAWGTKHMDKPFDRAMQCALSHELGNDHPIAKYWV